MSPNVTGAVLMMASMICFTINDTFVKLTGDVIPLGQLMTLRGIMASALIITLALVLGNWRLRLGRRAWALIAARSLTEMSAGFFFLSALFNMPLANVTAILQALPLTVALGAFVLFKDPIGWRRMMAILFGLVGMVLIVRPGSDGFSIWSFYALVAVLSVTLRDLITRQMPDHVPSITVAVVNTLAVSVFFAGIGLTETWQPVTPKLWAYLAASAVFIVGGYFFSVRVMRVGEISFTAPFRYTGLLVALPIGWAVFGDWPDALTLLGAAIIVAAGLFTLYRERVTSG